MSDLPCTLLVDNGSHRATSTLNLRRVASALSEEVGHKVHPVSLLHSTVVPAEKLDGIPADIMAPFLKKKRKEGVNSFLIVPLFFGHTAAIYEYVPQQLREMREKENWPELEMRLAPCMVDLDDPSNTDVAEIMATLVRQKIAEEGLEKPAVTLIDHGTPRRAVNLVRNFLCEQLSTLLNDEFGPVKPCSMERREGDEYAFNEPLLENLLGTPGFDKNVVLSMLFISPGRHAGPGGDIAEICEESEKEHEGVKTYMSDLFATHPGSIQVLAKRFHQGVASEPAIDEVPPPKALAELS